MVWFGREENYATPLRSLFLSLSTCFLREVASHWRAQATSEFAAWCRGEVRTARYPPRCAGPTSRRHAEAAGGDRDCGSGDCAGGGGGGSGSDVDGGSDDVDDDGESGGGDGDDGGGDGDDGGVDGDDGGGDGDECGGNGCNGANAAGSGGPWPGPRRGPPTRSPTTVLVVAEVADAGAAAVDGVCRSASPTPLVDAAAGGGAAPPPAACTSDCAAAAATDVAAASDATSAASASTRSARAAVVAKTGARTASVTASSAASALLRSR